MARPLGASLGASLLSLSLGACCSVPVEPGPSHWESYEPEIVELSGVLTLQERFGPPNYGETPEIDARLTIPVLELSTTLNVRGDPGSELNIESVEGVREVQLASLSASDLKRRLNTHVVCRGSLFRAVSGHHFTEVVLTVRRVRPAKKAHRRATGDAPGLH